MKNIFKKIAVVALAMIMCVGAAVPVTFAEDARCPGLDKTHTSGNCDYKVIAQSEASCEAGGFVTGQCNVCSVSFVVNSTEELGHEWETGEVSCLAATKKTCKRCGKEETVPGSATGHLFGEWITKGDKGCFVGNRRYRVCSACGETEEEKMNDAHSWVIAVYEAPAVCTAPGRATYVCENKDCGATKTAELWAKAEDASHNYQKWDIAKDNANYDAVIKLTKGRKDPNAVTLSCTNDAARTEICIDCGETRVIYTAKSTYQHTLKDMKYVDATLDLNGCKGTYNESYWECYYCGIMFEQKASHTSNIVETYYAKWGTLSPVYTAADIGYTPDYGTDNDGDGSKYDDTYYMIYYKYGWRDVEYYENYEKTNDTTVIFVDGDEFKKITKPTASYAEGHKKFNADGTALVAADQGSVAATCTTPGFTETNCVKCGLYSFKNTEALGHKFYPDLTTDSDKKAAFKEFGWAATSYDTASELKNLWTAVGNVAKKDGSGKIWEKVILPTCDESAKVVWNCLNDKDCTENKEAALTGSRNKAYGHDYTTVEVLPATCTTAGLSDDVCSRPVKSYTFVSGTKTVVTEKVEGSSDDLVCGSTQRKSVPALGHKWVKDTDNVENLAVSCKEDGVQWYECANAGCTETKKEVVASTGVEHLWNFSYGYITENTEPNCVSGVSGYAVCTKCDMFEPQLVEKEALGHKFVEINEEAMKLLEKKGDMLYVDADGKLYNQPATGRVLAAEYIAEGSCTESAIYKVICQRDGCSVISISEPNKDKVKEEHDIVVLSYWYNVDGVYDYNANGSGDDYYLSGNASKTVINALSCTATTYGNLWYCKNKDCADYRVEDLTLTTDSKWVDKNGDPAAPNRFEFYAKHKDAKTGEVITYKDVPDERVSGADSITEAQKVKAPVDENGNLIIAVEIPGTSLVWRYVVDEVTCDVDQVTTGGFYCVDCSNANYSASDKAVVGNTRAAHHQVKKGDDVPANCLAYGYTPYSCKNCDYTVQTDYVAKRESHEIDLANPVSTIKPTCDKSGTRVYQCGYSDCRQFVTVIDAPLGHFNVSGDELLTSCLDPNANIENRRCKNCSQIIFSAHNYVDGQCDECGAVKVD